MSTYKYSEWLHESTVYEQLQINWLRYVC